MNWQHSQEAEIKYCPTISKLLDKGSSKTWRAVEIVSKSEYLGTSFRTQIWMFETICIKFGLNQNVSIIFIMAHR